MYQICTQSPSKFLIIVSRLLSSILGCLLCLSVLIIYASKASADRQMFDPQDLVDAEKAAQERFAEFADSLEASTDQGKIRYLVQTLNQIDRSLFIYANPSLGTNSRGQTLDELSPLDQARLDALQYDNSPLTESDLAIIHHFLNTSKNRLGLVYDLNSLGLNMLLKNYDRTKEVNKWVSIASWASSGMAIAFGFMPEVPAVASLVPLSGMLYFTLLEHKLKRSLRDMQRRLSSLSDKEAKEETKRFLQLITQITVAMKVFEHVKTNVSASSNACSSKFQNSSMHFR